MKFGILYTIISVQVHRQGCDNDIQFSRINVEAQNGFMFVHWCECVMETLHSLCVCILRYKFWLVTCCGITVVRNYKSSFAKIYYEVQACHMFF